jgi:hypothetical protein
MLETALKDWDEHARGGFDGLVSSTATFGNTP